jgi:pentatricopeptide repeat protein
MSVSATIGIVNFAAALEVIEVLQVEICMFGVAAAVYLLFAFGAKSPVLATKPSRRSTKTQCNDKAIGTDSRQNRHNSAGRDHIDVSKCRIDVPKLAAQIRDFGKEGSLSKAIAIFEDLKNQRVTLTTLLYNSILDACVHCSATKEASTYFEEAKQSGFVDVVSFNLLIKNQIASEKFHAACELLGEMEKCSIQPSHVTFHSLLHASSQAGDKGWSWSCVAKMRAAGLKPTSVTCSILLKLITGRSDQKDLSRILELIEESGLALDEVLISSVIEGCMKAQRLDLLEEQLCSYSKQGVCLNISAPAYGSMIKAFGSAGNVDRVWTLWQEMRRSKVQPSEVTLGCMVDALVTNSSVDSAWQLVQELWNEEGERCLVNTVIYSTILKGFAINRRMDKAVALYDEMKSRNVACNTIVYNTMLNAFVRCGDLKRIPKLLEDMRAATPPIEPDMITYSTIIKGYCCAGDLDKSLTLLKEMEAGGQFLADEVMYNSLLDGCAKQQRLEEALSLLKRMRKANIAPSNYTLSIMIKLLGRSKRLTQAFEMLKDMTANNAFRPNIQVYTCLMQACFHNKQLGQALALHDKCVDENCKLDEMAYTSLARGCIQAGALDKAVQVVRCANAIPGHGLRIAAGPAPGIDARCVEDLVKKLHSSGKAVVARSLVVELERKRHKGKSNSGNVIVSDKKTSAPWRRADDASTTGSDGSTAASPRSEGSRDSGIDPPEHY